MGRRKTGEEIRLWWRADRRTSAGGCWTATIPGVGRRSFGPEEGKAKELLEEYLTALAENRDPSRTYGTITVGDLYSEYVDHQHARAQRGEIKPREFEDKRRHLDHFVAAVGERTLAAGIGPHDFSRYHRDRLGREFGIEQVQKRVYTIRDMFEHAADMDLLRHRVKFGPDFKPLDNKALKTVKARAPKTLDRTPYRPAQVRRLIREAEQPLRSMILLAVNCGFGPTDCGELTLDKLHLRVKRDAAGAIVGAGGYHDFPRPKNQAVERRCPLWRRTVLSLVEWLAIREAKLAHNKRRRRELVAPGDRDRVFLTYHGKPFVRTKVLRDADGRIEKVIEQDSVNPEFRKLCERLGLPANFYRLKHTAITWMSAARDPHAEHRIRGHELPGMSRVYVHEVESHRLRHVVTVLRRKLYPPKRPAGASTPDQLENRDGGSAAPPTPGRRSDRSPRRGADARETGSRPDRRRPASGDASPPRRSPS